MLNHISRNISGVTVHGEHAANTVVAKDYSSFSELVERLIGFASELWVEAVLQHGEPLPNKLIKVTVFVRGEPHSVFDFEHTLVRLLAY